MSLRSFSRRGEAMSRSCSHTEKTWYPSWLRRDLTDLLRCLFRLIFSIQNLPFVSGTLKWRWQPCQKHPSTKMQRLSEGIRKSGLPLTRGWYSKGIPSFSKIFFKKSSGLVLELLILDIISDLFSLDTVSMPLLCSVIHFCQGGGLQ